MGVVWSVVSLLSLGHQESPMTLPQVLSDVSVPHRGGILILSALFLSASDVVSLLCLFLNGTYFRVVLQSHTPCAHLADLSKPSLYLLQPIGTYSFYITLIMRVSSPQ